MLTGDQALAVLGMIGQQNIMLTQHAQALAEQRQANTDAAQMIEQLRTERDEARAEAEANKPKPRARKARVDAGANGA